MCSSRSGVRHVINTRTSKGYCTGKGRLYEHCLPELSRKVNQTRIQHSLGSVNQVFQFTTRQKININVQRNTIICPSLIHSHEMQAEVFFLRLVKLVYIMLKLACKKSHKHVGSNSTSNESNTNSTNCSTGAWAWKIHLTLLS